jgi:O-methyltransferase involved in polyketide biosynthesis
MTNAASPLALEQLSKISQTAWLTAFCHHDCGKDWALKRPVSSWLIERLGAPPFAGELSFFTRHGISARAKWFDDQIVAALAGFAASNEKVEIWTLGAGFDSRWHWILQCYGAAISRYREFDFGDLLETKNEVLSLSPWRERWSEVERHAGDLMADAKTILPRVDGPVIVVVEGLLDYFDRDRKLALLDALRGRAPRSTILLDAQSAWLLAQNNKRARRATGAVDVTFAWAPPDPVGFYDAIEGCEVTSHKGLLPDLIRRRLPLLRFVPMPKKIERAYSLIAVAARTVT